MVSRHMVVQMNCIRHCKRPQCVAIVVWPTECCMEHENSGSASNVFDCILSRDNLVVCSYSTSVNSLGTMLKLLSELFCSINTIITVLFLDVDTNRCCLPLKSKLGLNSFNSSKAKLMFNVHVGACSINKNSASFV